MKIPPRKRKSSVSYLRKIALRMNVPFRVGRGPKSEIFSAGSSTEAVEAHPSAGLATVRAETESDDASGSSETVIDTGMGSALAIATELDPIRHGPPVLRAFLLIADVWDLTESEQMALLGIRDLATFNAWIRRVREMESVALPLMVVERAGLVLSIYNSLVKLLPECRTGRWLRVPNSDSTFEGANALSKMTTGDMGDLRAVARYLLGEIHR